MSQSEIKSIKWASDRLTLAWVLLEKGDLKLVERDDEGVLRDTKEYGIVGWVVRYVQPFNQETKSYSDRLAVGFIVTNDYEEKRVRLFTFSQGLQTIINEFEELAESFEIGGELPKPKIGLLI